MTTLINNSAHALYIYYNLYAGETEALSQDIYKFESALINSTHTKGEKLIKLLGGGDRRVKDSQMKELGHLSENYFNLPFGGESSIHII